MVWTLRSAVTCAGALFLSGAITSWWLVGDLSEEMPLEAGLDYLYKAPEIPEAVTGAAGVAGAVVALVLMRRLASRKGFGAPAFALFLCGLITGGLGRVMTAGVIGANIGGGMALMFAMPFVVIATTVSLSKIALRTAAMDATQANGP